MKVSEDTHHRMAASMDADIRQGLNAVRDTGKELRKPLNEMRNAIEGWASGHERVANLYLKGEHSESEFDRAKGNLLLAKANLFDKLEELLPLLRHINDAEEAFENGLFSASDKSEALHARTQGATP